MKKPIKVLNGMNEWADTLLNPSGPTPNTTARIVAPNLPQRITMAPTAAPINNGNVANRRVRRRAGAPKNTAMPVLVNVFETTAMTIVRAAIFKLSGSAAARFAMEREMASTSVRPARAPAM